LEKYAGSPSSDTMPSSASPSFNLLIKKDYSLFEWVEMVVMENWALSTVEKKLYWKRMKQNYNFSIKTV
jgi:hypothetical protein